MPCLWASPAVSHFGFWLLERVSFQSSGPAGSAPTVKPLSYTKDWLSQTEVMFKRFHCLQKVSSSESPKQSASELVKPNPLVRSSSNISVQNQPKEDQSPEDQPKEDVSEDHEQLQGTVKSLKEELSALQEQLLEKE